MLAKNYYDVLGLAPSCALKDIKKSYHKLALVWHPDKHGDKSEAQTKFTEINEAYTILADNKKRMIYDTCGQAGLDMEQDLQDFTEYNQSNIFYQKGFQGTDKSAFDVLRDIFEESDDEDDFFDDCNLFDLTDDFKTNIKSFIEDNIMASENEEGDNFFKNYTPTFMDADFFCQPPSLFEQIIPDGTCPAETEFFHFFSSLDSDIENYSMKSTTVFNNKKVRTSTKQRMQKGNTIYEDEEHLEYTNLGSRPSKKTKNNKNKYIEEVIIEEEDLSALLGKNKNKQKKQKKHAKSTELGGRLHAELLVDDDLLDEGLKYNKKNHKKSSTKV